MRKSFLWVIENAFMEMFGPKLSMASAGGPGLLTMITFGMGWGLLFKWWPWLLVFAPLTGAFMFAVFYWGVLRLIPPPFGRSDLEIRFCNDKGMLLKEAPIVSFWNQGAHVVGFRLGWGDVKITNHTSQPVTIDSCWFVLKTNGKELAKRDCPSLVNLRLQGNDTNPEPIDIHSYAGFSVQDHELIAQIGHRYDKARMDMIVKSGRKQGFLRFKMARLSD